MIVSWNWLQEYVGLDMSVEQLEQRLMMAGLNHEGTESVDGDVAIDLEVTSNRPDCLGHIGVAREVAVLYGQRQKIPEANPPTSKPPVDSLARVSIQCPELCSRYTARVIRGARVAPSPDWMVQRLKTIGVAAINNVVDISNYVLMECGQPLHVFDLQRLKGQEIIVRCGRPGEEFLAINHKTYELDENVCVIADASHPVALGGVMGGADSEVSDSTTDLLIESAMFDPISIRTTARKLILHSDSSYRFERGPDPEGVDWASRRCCQLLLELAGGELAEGVIDVGEPPSPRPSIVLRLAQLERILGIRVEPDEVRRILEALGNKLQTADESRIEVIPPSWRQDLTREVDLVEEVARIHGYEEIPEDAQVPMAASVRSDEDRVLHRVRQALNAEGYDEAMTASVVDDQTSDAFSPWSDGEPLGCQTPLLRGATRLRRSLIPSLLTARRLNETLSNPVIELFEIANVYLPRADALPAEEEMVAVTSGGDYFHVKGVLEGILAAVNCELPLEVTETQDPFFEGGRCGELRVAGQQFGFLGEVSRDGLKHFDLRDKTTVAEIRLSVLVDQARLVPLHRETSPYPAVERDMNFEVEESVRWSDLAATVRDAAGELLEELRYLETYRDTKRLGPNKKSLVMRVVLRKADGTMTGEEADAIRDAIVGACQKNHGATLRA